MAQRQKADTPPLAKEPGQYTLRQLLLLMFLVCVLGGAISWFREESEFAIPVFVITSWVTIAFLLHSLAKLSPGEIVSVMAILIPLTSLVVPFPVGSRHASRRSICSNHLKQLGLALQNYHDMYGSFPPAYIADASGTPMHSWRVLILPFCERKTTYDRYKFSEPWDGPNNSKLAAEMPECFRCPSSDKRQPIYETNYVAVIGPQTMWPGEKATSLSDITDGTPGTIALVESHNSGIHWMEPRDLHIVQMPMAVNPLRGQGISSSHPNVALAVLADGHTQALTSNTPADVIRALLTIAGGETIPDY